MNITIENTIEMKKNNIFVVLAMLVTSVTFAQKPKKQVLIPDYVETYEYLFNREIEVDGTDVVIPVRPEYRRRSNDIFVIGNFNKVNIIKPHIDIPQCTVDSNNYEYVKTTQFNPNKTLQEIID